MSLLDLETRACLFDHVASWGGDSSSEALSSLVKSFFQLASELDAGAVAKVKFAVGETRPSKHSRNRSRTGPVLSGARKAFGAKSGEMYLEFYRGDHALVAAFVQHAPHEDTSVAMASFFRAVDAAFGEHRARQAKAVCEAADSKPAEATENARANEAEADGSAGLAAAVEACVRTAFGAPAPTPATATGTLPLAPS